MGMGFDSGLLNLTLRVRARVSFGRTPPCTMLLIVNEYSMVVDCKVQINLILVANGIRIPAS